MERQRRRRVDDKMGVKSKASSGGGTWTRECCGKMVRGQGQKERKEESAARGSGESVREMKAAEGVGPGARESSADERIPAGLRPSPG